MMSKYVNPSARNNMAIKEARYAGFLNVVELLERDERVANLKYTIGQVHF